MRKIKLGRREFELMPFSSELAELLKSKSEKLGENIAFDKDMKSDIGNEILFVLIACLGNEFNALQVGEMLHITEDGYVTMDQVSKALSIVREEFHENK